MSEIDIEQLKGKIAVQHDNDQKQLEVIFSEASRLMVEAPAGYGKTTTMISRIAYLFATGKIPNPKRILGLTFSVNAALKIKRDIAEKLPSLIGGQNNPSAINEKVTATNYHGFCKIVLKKYGYLVAEALRRDINLFRAVGDADVDRIDELKAVLSAQELDSIKNIESTIKLGNVPNEQSIIEYNKLVVQKLLPLGYITHNAIILFTITLLSNNAEVQKFYQSYYPLIIVDEFQDTNSIAWRLLTLLINAKTKLLFLGDPLQRIYGFIGALPNIMSLAVESYDMVQICLEKNYRFDSNPEMLKLDANIRANAAKLFINDPSMNVAALPAFFGKDQEDESTQIAEKVCDLLKTSENYRIAILCRARGCNSDKIEQALSIAGVTYFYGMFTDDDPVYVDFHIKCQSAFIHKFGKTRTINRKALLAFVADFRESFPENNNKVITSLLSLLDALVVKISTDYATITPEDKYQLMIDILENRQLKQAMEYIDTTVIVATVHGAKGLEWDYVFLSDLERWIFPSPYVCKICPQKFSPLVRYTCRFDQSSIAGEFRDAIIDELSVFYVGVTRARKQVFVSASARRYNATGDEKESGFSCFASLYGIRLVRA